MLNKVIELSEKYPGATLTTYLCDDTAELKMPKRRAIVVMPGGGYHFLSDREAEPIAMQFLAAGFHTFILRYTVGKPHDGNPGAAGYAPLIEASLAVKHVREHAEEYNIDPEKIFVIGFSAGGHLAASLGILWHSEKISEAVDMTYGINKPNGMILSYPVITAGKYAHKGSIQNVSGSDNPSPEQIEAFSLEKHVDERTCPAFIWHTFSDTCVPVQNSLLLADAMTAAKVPFEMHIFPAGVHGLSLATEDVCSKNQNLIVPHVQCWIELAIKWAKEL